MLNPPAALELSPRCRPVQKRAQETVEQILRTAATLLDEVGVDEFNTNLLAEKAGIRIRTVYRYFPNKLAVIVALAERIGAWEQKFAAETLDPKSAGMGWQRALEQVIDAYVEGVLSIPGFIAVRRATKAVPELQAVETRVNERLARMFVLLLRLSGIDLPEKRMNAIARSAIEASSAVLDLSYTGGRAYRRELIDELKRMQVAYLSTYLNAEGQGGRVDGTRAS